MKTPFLKNLARGESSAASSDDQENAQLRRRRRPFLPVLIIPGFLSSGLVIEKSNIREKWEGKRLWLNLLSLGFDALRFGRERVILGNTTATAADSNPDEVSGQHDAENQDPASGEMKQFNHFKSLWLQHITLLDDMQTEHPGVTVRNIDGLPGVDYLTPGTLTSAISYVFGPVIEALVKVGYEKGKNLDAAPFDWRIPPDELEKRDQYFTKTMHRVEKMYQDNKIPVVLFGHSLGGKMCHYFLNFCKLKKGQEWIDQHIYSFMAVATPHLGTPRALRTVVSGTKIGLDAFLTDEEALALVRSLGAGAWLFPTSLPDHTGIPNAIVRKQGSFTIQIVGDVHIGHILSCRDASHKPNKVKVMVMFGSKTLTSSFVDVNDDKIRLKEESFVFATQADRPVDHDSSNRLVIFLSEPGLGVARKKDKTTSHPVQPKSEDPVWLCCFKFIFCWCILKHIFRCLWCCTKQIGDATLQAADKVAKASGGSSVFAFSNEIAFFQPTLPPRRSLFKSFASPSFFRASTMINTNPKIKSETLQVVLCHRDRRHWWETSEKETKCTIKVTWEPWVDEPTQPAQDTARRVPVCERAVTVPSLAVQHDKADNPADYAELSGHECLVREDLGRIMSLLGSIYDSDPLGPRSLSAASAPPVKHVKAIYGINLPTEAGAVYKRRAGYVESRHKVKNVFVLEKSAKLVGETHGFICDGGVLFETQDVNYPCSTSGNKQVSGDATVPYWSLRQPNEWRDECDVVIDEIDGADHRGILKDDRFHEILIDYITKAEEENTDAV